MKRGEYATYAEWLTCVETGSLKAWLIQEAKLIMKGNEFAKIYKGPYPIRQEDNETDAEVAQQCKQIKVPRTQRLQWFAAELERRANGGAIAPKVCF